ncbi:hypothetical protein Z043_100131 [Scleropages formosus]|nr:G-protein coupled receptor 4-like isoform X2 [Scleropages formosus]KPP80229.1 hypothetical protein Z043_100131 [Scleropages formosus]
MEPFFNQTAGNGVVGNTCGIDFTQDAVFLPVLYGVFFIIGIPLNLMALYGLYKLIRTENILPVFVFNLLLSDFLQLSTLPLWMDYYRKDHYWSHGPRACQFMGLVFYVSIYVSIFSMCIIALERHLAIAQPLRFQALRSLKFAVSLAVAVWVVVTLPPSIAFETLFPAKQNFTLCIEKYPSEETFITYRLITLILSFALPFTFIFILHTMTLKSLAGVGSLMMEEKKRIKRFLNLLIVIFVSVLGPYHLIGCIKYIGLALQPEKCKWEKSVFVSYQLGRGLLSLNSLLDPVMYIFLRNDFREAARHYLDCSGGSRWQSVRKSRSRAISRSERPTNSSQESELYH